MQKSTNGGRSGVHTLHNFFQYCIATVTTAGRVASTVSTSDHPVGNASDQQIGNNLETQWLAGKDFHADIRISSLVLVVDLVK